MTRPSEAREGRVVKVAISEGLAEAIEMNPEILRWMEEEMERYIDRRARQFTGLAALGGE